MNDADRLRHDPAMRWIVGVKATSGAAAWSRGLISGPTRVSPIPKFMSVSKPSGSNTQDRSPANRILQERIGHLLMRPIGRPPNEVRRSYANFTYQAGSWTKSPPRRRQGRWHPGELYPRVGFIVTN